MAESPYVIAATAVKTIIDTEFAPEGIVAEHDHLHESVGWDGSYAGISPDYERPEAGNMAALGIWIKVQLYLPWDKEINPFQVVDPRIIARYGQRFREAVRAANLSYSGQFWFFNVMDLRYPHDPTGNKTRFEASVKAWAENNALVETTA
jgi:hypothetical protein